MLGRSLKSIFVHCKKDYQMSDKSNGFEEFLNRAEIYELTMLPGESHDEYEEMLRALYEEFKPCGLMEEDQILKMATAVWKRKRWDRFLQIKMAASQRNIRVTNKFSHVFEKLKNLAPEFLKTASVKEVEKLRAVIGDPLAKEIVAKKWPVEKCKNANAWGRVIAEGLSTI